MNSITINQHTKEEDKFEFRKFNFLLCVEEKKGCWIWKGTIGKDGYGKCGTFNETWAHRVSFRIFKGKIPKGKCVLHACDKPICVKPDHLFIGTQQDNIRDKVRKNRQAKVLTHGSVTHPEIVRKGSNHHKSKVDEETVLKIRKEHDGKHGIGVYLSNKYGLSQSQICCIVKRRGWKHV